MTKSMQEKLERFKTGKLNPADSFLDSEENKPKKINESKENKVDEEVKDEISVTSEPTSELGMAGFLESQSRRNRIEDTHTRRTFLIRNDLLKRFDNISKKVGSKGFKTNFINFVISDALNELEQEFKDQRKK